MFSNSQGKQRKGRGSRSQGERPALILHTLRLLPLPQHWPHSGSCQSCTPASLDPSTDLSLYLTVLGAGGHLTRQFQGVLTWGLPLSKVNK